MLLILPPLLLLLLILPAAAAAAAIASASMTTAAFCLFSAADFQMLPPRSRLLSCAATVQIIDFGLSRFEETNEVMTTRVGTPYCEKKCYIHRKPLF